MSPHPKSIEAWNKLYAAYDGKGLATMVEAVTRFIAMCRRSGDPTAHQVASELAIRLAICKRFGFRPWPGGEWTG